MVRRARHPGTVRSDVQAFQQISSRFQNEVGTILGRIDFGRGLVPFWALMRMMFPVAESLGDLIYRKDKATAQNLRSVLDNEFEEVRAGYLGKAALLTLLYRHPLTHHDELQILTSGGKEVGWRVTRDRNGNHLRISPRAGVIMIEFQPRTFFVDIVAVCTRAQRKKWRGEVKKRYTGGRFLIWIPHLQMVRSRPPKLSRPQCGNAYVNMTNKRPLPPAGFDDPWVEDQIDYIQSLWDRIAAKPDQVSVPEWHHKQVLDERLAAPESGRSWEEVRDEIRSKLSRS